MSWTDPETKSTGNLITAAYWNQMLGPSGNQVLTAPGVFTTAGDIIYGTGDNATTRLGKGTARQALAMNSGATAPEWAASSRSVLTTAGDVMYASGTNTPARLGKGAARENLTMNSGATAPEWTASPASLLTAEGDILYASAANTVARLAKGDDDDTLVMNGNVPNWEAAAAGGLTEADSWRNTVGFAPGVGTTYVLTANLARVTSTGFGLLGTGMSESSGVFTFPSTGYWAVLASFGFSLAGDSRYDQGTIEASVDAGSTWAAHSMQVTGSTQFESASLEYYIMVYALFDVTDTANVKVRFSIHDLDDSGVNVSGTDNRTSFHFLKLGDT